MSCLAYGLGDVGSFLYGFTTASDAEECVKSGSTSACIMLAIGITPLGVLGMVGKGAKKAVPEKWFTDLPDALPNSKPHTHNGVTPKITDHNQLKHVFNKHGPEWYGRKVPQETHIQEFTELIQRGMMSKEVVPWNSPTTQTYAYINRFDGKNFVVQVDRQTGELVTAFIPTKTCSVRCTNSLGSEMAYKGPSAPQLSVSGYPAAGAQDELFWQMCGVIGDEDNAPLTSMEALPASLSFDMISDVAEQLRAVDPAQGMEALGDWRAVEAHLLSAKRGVVEVRFEPADEPDRHTVSALVYAGAMAFPVEIWTPRQREEAAELAGWARRSLRAVCERSEVLYGEVGVESWVPGPSQIVSEGRGLQTTAYLSKSLLPADSSFLRGLRARYGEGVVEEWPTGFFICGWAPLSAAGLEVDDHQGLLTSVADYLAEQLPYVS